METNNTHPRVSIGMPVYNGERFLQEALDSILAQTFQDFELIISDNASTDRTQEICRAYVAKDQRIRYYCNTQNLGAAWNFNRVFELSQGEYFKWAAYDDTCAPTFIEQCIQVLDQQPSVVLCHSQTRIIDEHGQVLENYDCKLNTHSPKPHKRFGDLILKRHACFQLFGVMRANVLRMTSGHGAYVGGDRILLAELGLFGQFHEVPEYLFFRRDHPQTSTRLFPNQRKRLTFMTLTKPGYICFPNFRFGVEYFKAVTGTPLGWSERLLCYIELGRWLKRKRRSLIKDLKAATTQVSKSWRYLQF